MESRMYQLITNRAQSVQPFLGRAMSEKARALERKGEKLIHFELGEPDFDTPEHIKEAAKGALDENYTHYSSTAGLLELREAIAEKLKEENNLEADPTTEICVTVGSQEAAFLVMMCTIDPGDEVLITDPGYYAHKNSIRIAEGKPVSVPINKENEFKLDREDLEAKITSKSKMIIINSPSNPTGSVMTEADLKAIDELAIEHDLLVISDEIYEKIIYDGKKHYSIASLSKNPDRIITINGFSKAYAMTGWRIGYAVANKTITSSIVKMQETVTGCATTFAQKGAVEALKGPREPVQKMWKEFEKRREVIMDVLNEVKGFSVVKPKGAFYAFVDVKKICTSGQELAEYLLNKAKVVTTPGVAFGENGEGYVRFSYATTIENIKEAGERIRQAVEDQHGH